MKALIKSALTLLCLAIPAITLAHTGHGADGNLFHGLVHSDWVVVIFTLVIVVTINGLNNKNRKN